MKDELKEKLLEMLHDEQYSLEELNRMLESDGRADHLVVLRLGRMESLIVLVENL